VKKNSEEAAHHRRRDRVRHVRVANDMGQNQGGGREFSLAKQGARQESLRQRWSGYQCKKYGLQQTPKENIQDNSAELRSAVSSPCEWEKRGEAGPKG